MVSDAKGGKALNAIDIRSKGRTERLNVDALAMAGGFSPIIHLACHRGGKPVWSDDNAAFLAPGNLNGMALAGSVCAVGGLAACLADGARQGATMAEGLGFKAAAAEFGAVENDILAPPERAIWSITGVKGKAFVDFQNDVHRKDLFLAVSEGYGHVELAKRYTTNGMATDQGKLSNINAIGLLAERAASRRQTSARRLSGHSIRLSPSGR
ncbi:hypothetical protein AJ87_36255 [Rhizobium yanglingense]|nr:hypothetical protein AJ87_36255 [Rhizobium yanglingense]